MFYGMAFARMLALFDAAITYIIITTGAGDGSGDDGSTKKTLIRSDEPGAYNKIAGMTSHTRVIRPEHVSPDIRDLISPDFNPMKQHERR